MVHGKSMKIPSFERDDDWGYPFDETETPIWWASHTFSWNPWDLPGSPLWPGRHLRPSPWPFRWMDAGFALPCFPGPFRRDPWDILDLMGVMSHPSECVGCVGLVKTGLPKLVGDVKTGRSWKFWSPMMWSQGEWSIPRPPRTVVSAKKTPWTSLETHWPHWKVEVSVLFEHWSFDISWPSWNLWYKCSIRHYQLVSCVKHVFVSHWILQGHSATNQQSASTDPAWRRDTAQVSAESARTGLDKASRWFRVAPTQQLIGKWEPGPGKIAHGPFY